MAKTQVVVTDTWQNIATGPAVFTIKKVGVGNIAFNTTETLDTAYEDVPAVGDQFQQTDALNTKVKADRADAGWVIIVDGAL